MENKGYVKVFRRLHRHWLWEEKPFGKGQAWVDLVLMASYCTSRFRHGNQVKEVHRGMLLTSLQKLSVRWGWSTKKVGAFLTLLEAENMVKKDAAKTHTTITILNYDQWQGDSSHISTQVSTQLTAQVHTQGTSKELSKVTTEEAPQTHEIREGGLMPETQKTHKSITKGVSQDATKGTTQVMSKENIQEVKEVQEIEKVKEIKEVKKQSSRSTDMSEARERIEYHARHQQRNGKTDQYKNLNICLHHLDL